MLFDLPIIQIFDINQKLAKISNLHARAEEKNIFLMIFSISELDNHPKGLFVLFLQNFGNDLATME